MPSSDQQTPRAAAPGGGGQLWRTLCLVLGLSWWLFSWGAWPLAWHLVLKGSLDPQRPGLTGIIYKQHSAGGRFQGSQALTRSEGVLQEPDTSLHAYGFWQVPADGDYLLRLSCDDEGLLKIDGQRLIKLEGINARNLGDCTLHLKAGPHLLEVDLVNILDQGWFKLEAQGPGAEAPALLESQSLYQADLGNFGFWSGLVSAAEAVSGRGLGGLAALLVVLGLGCLRLPRTLALWCCVLVTLAGGVGDIYGKRGRQMVDQSRADSTLLRVLYDLESYLHSPAHRQAKRNLPGLVLLGDSSHAIYVGAPDSMLNITRKIVREEGGGGKVEVYGLAHPGFHVFDYYFLLNRIAQERPRLVILPVNVRTFGSISHRFWFEELYGYIQWSELLNPAGLSSPSRPVPWGKLLSAKVENTCLNGLGLPFLLAGQHQWKTMQEGLEQAFQKEVKSNLGLEHWVGPPTDATKEKAAEWVDVTPGHFLFPVYRRINHLARQYGITVLYYAVPLNLGYTHLPRSFMHDSYAVIRQQLADPPYAYFLDLSDLVPDDQFVDALEHFTPPAKRRIAQALMQQAWPLLVK